MLFASATVFVHAAHNGSPFHARLWQSSGQRTPSPSFVSYRDLLSDTPTPCEHTARPQDVQRIRNAASERSSSPHADGLPTAGCFGPIVCWIWLISHRDRNALIVCNWHVPATRARYKGPLVRPLPSATHRVTSPPRPPSSARLLTAPPHSSTMRCSAILTLAAAVASVSAAGLNRRQASYPGTFRPT